MWWELAFWLMDGFLLVMFVLFFMSREWNKRTSKEVVDLNRQLLQMAKMVDDERSEKLSIADVNRRLVDENHGLRNTLFGEQQRARDANQKLSNLITPDQVCELRELPNEPFRHKGKGMWNVDQSGSEQPEQ